MEYCKGIAERIMGILSDNSDVEFDNIISYGCCKIKVDKDLINNLKLVGKDKYIGEINKYLKECCVSDIVLAGEKSSLIISIELDDVDEEFEDW